MKLLQRIQLSMLACLLLNSSIQPISQQSCKPCDYTKADEQRATLKEIIATLQNKVDEATTTLQELAETIKKNTSTLKESHAQLNKVIKIRFPGGIRPCVYTDADQQNDTTIDLLKQKIAILNYENDQKIIALHKTAASLNKALHDLEKKSTELDELSKNLSEKIKKPNGSVNIWI